MQIDWYRHPLTGLFYILRYATERYPPGNISPSKGEEMFAPWSVVCSVCLQRLGVFFFLGCHIFEEGIPGYPGHLDSHKVARNVILPRVFSRCCMLFALPAPWFPFFSSSKSTFLVADCWRNVPQMSQRLLGTLAFVLLERNDDLGHPEWNSKPLRPKHEKVGDLYSFKWNFQGGSWFSLKQLSVRAVKQFDTITVWYHWWRKSAISCEVIPLLLSTICMFFVYIPFGAGFPLSRVCLISKNQTAADIKIPAPAATPRFWVSPPGRGWKKTGGLLDWNSPLTRDPWPSTPPKNRVFIIYFPGQKQQRELGRLLSSTVLVQSKHSCFRFENLREPKVLMCQKTTNTYFREMFPALDGGGFFWMLQKHTSIHVLEHGFSWYISALWILRKIPVLLNWITVSSCDGSRSLTIWSTCQSINNIYNHTGVDFQWIGYT